MQFTHTDLNKTLRVKPGYMEKTRKWRESDAEGVVLGKLAEAIAKKLTGKDKAHHCDFWDAGDFVVVYNVDKIKVTGNKLLQKIYYRYSGWKGNVKSINLQDLLKKHPERALRYAVRGMLPKNKLRDRRMKRLKMTTSKTDTFAHYNPQELKVAA